MRQELIATIRKSTSLGGRLAMPRQKTVRGCFRFHIPTSRLKHFTIFCNAWDPDSSALSRECLTHRRWRRQTRQRFCPPKTKLFLLRYTGLLPYVILAENARVIFLNCPDLSNIVVRQRYPHILRPTGDIRRAPPHYVLVRIREVVTCCGGPCH
jgi:hypothetical protein